MGNSSSMEKEVRQTSCISQQPQCSKKEEWTISRHQWCCYCLHSSVIAIKKEQERYSVLLYSVVNQQKRISRCAALFQKSHTPMKTQQFKHTSDGTKLIIHHLTKYSFQYSEDTMATLLILSVAKNFNSFSDWNKVIIYGKIVYMCDQELVCQNKLRLVQATFTDVTWLMYARLIMSDMLIYSSEVTWSCVHAIRLECNKRFEHETTDTTETITIDLWEENIARTKIETVYQIAPIQVHVWKKSKKTQPCTVQLLHLKLIQQSFSFKFQKNRWSLQMKLWQ